MIIFCACRCGIIAVNKVQKISEVTGPLAQLAEQLTLNQRVAGSIPARPTIHFLHPPEISHNSRLPCWVEVVLLQDGETGQKAR